MPETSRRPLPATTTCLRLMRTNFDALAPLRRHCTPHRRSARGDPPHQAGAPQRACGLPRSSPFGSGVPGAGGLSTRRSPAFVLPCRRVPITYRLTKATPSCFTNSGVSKRRRSSLRMSRGLRRSRRPPTTIWEPRSVSSGVLADALDCYERALAIDPRHLDALLNCRPSAHQVRSHRGSRWRATATCSDSARIRRLPTTTRDRFTTRRECVPKRGRRLNPPFQSTETARKRGGRSRWRNFHSRTDRTRTRRSSAPDSKMRSSSSRTWFAAGRMSLGHRAVGNLQPFYLAYHEVDNRAILERYGDLCARLMQAWRPAEPALRVRPRTSQAGPAGNRFGLLL